MVTSDEFTGVVVRATCLCKQVILSKTTVKKQVNEAITVYGTELKSNNTRLAKMNLAIHGIDGKIIESNSFYTDPHADLVGKWDFVMANPPFNVNKVDKKKDFVKTDKRLFPDAGLPNTDNGNVYRRLEEAYAVYGDDEVNQRADLVYQHIYSNHSDRDRNIYAH